jgi:hypothetical protein
MKTKEEILKILSDEMPFIKSKFNVFSCGLFGSYSHGDPTPESDIDVLVQFEKPVGFFKFIELEDYLSEKIGIKIELVTEDALKPLIKPHIMESVIYV